jgi:hypothetical protein
MAYELEKELQQRIISHKYSIIASSLIMFEKEGIYNSYLLRDKYGDEKTTERGQERAFKVADELDEQADQETYDQIYEMCWQRAKHKISDKLYGIDT